MSLEKRNQDLSMCQFRPKLQSCEKIAKGGTELVGSMVVCGAGSNRRVFCRSRAFVNVCSAVSSAFIIGITSSLNLLI